MSSNLDDQNFTEITSAVHSLDELGGEMRNEIKRLRANLEERSSCEVPIPGDTLRRISKVLKETPAELTIMIQIVEAVNKTIEEI